MLSAASHANTHATAAPSYPTIRNENEESEVGGDIFLAKVLGFRSLLEGDLTGTGDMPCPSASAGRARATPLAGEKCKTDGGGVSGQQRGKERERGKDGRKYGRTGFPCPVPNDDRTKEPRPVFRRHANPKSRSTALGPSVRPGPCAAPFLSRTFMRLRIARNRERKRDGGRERACCVGPLAESLAARMAGLSEGKNHTPHTVYSLTKRVSPEMLQTFDATNL